MRASWQTPTNGAVSAVANTATSQSLQYKPPMPANVGEVAAHTWVAAEAQKLWKYTADLTGVNAFSFSAGG